MIIKIEESDPTGIQGYIITTDQSEGVIFLLSIDEAIKKVAWLLMGGIRTTQIKDER